MACSLKRWKRLYPAILVACFGLLFVISTPVNAANPTTISFQGKVVNANGTNVTDGNYGFVFKLYTVSSGGSAIWTETDTSVAVASGTFQVNLGAVCPFFTANACNGNTPIDFNANPALYLGITFNSDPAGEMTPRVQLQSVPYAYNADKVGGLTNSQLVQLTPAGGQQSGSVNVTSVITPSLTSTGALTINSGAATNVSIDSAAAGTAAINIGSTNATSVALSRTGETTEVKGALQVDQTSLFQNSVVMTFTGTENLAVTSALGGTVNGLSFIGTPSATAGTANGLFIQQASSTNANGLDNGLVIDNADNNDVIGAAINITNTGGGGYTNYINSPNFIVSGSGQIYGKGFNYFDPSTLTASTALLTSGGAAGGNFGGALDSGAFIGDDDTYSQEFVGSKASIDTNNTIGLGDDGKWYYNNDAGTPVGTDVAFSDVSTDGGFARLTTSTRSGTGALIVEGSAAGVIDAPLAASNLPIVQMKVRPSVARVTDDLVWGMMDTATAPIANDTLPTNGIFFWSDNSTGTTGWEGEVRSGGAVVGTPVVCPGNVTAGEYAVGRIVVVNATTVNFFIDNNTASGGVSMTDCGVVTGTLPTANMAMGMYVVHTVATASTFDLDYARFWQDDSASSSDQDASVTAGETAQADISTASDDTSNDVSAADVTGASTDADSDGTDAAITPDTPAPDPTLDAADDSSAIQPTPPDTAMSSDSSQISLTSSNSFSLTDSGGQQIAVVDDSGNVTYNGGLNATDATLTAGLNVGGDSTFAGLSTFQKLATFLDKAIFHGDVEFDGHLTVSSDTAGYASLRTGESSVHVSFAEAYTNPPVVTAEVTNGQFVLSSVNNVTDQGFDISLQNPAAAPTTFSWTAVGVTNPQTATNPLPVTTSTPSN